nr:alpha/beta hydrolase-fold protein [Flavihumibacter fluvii]
MCLEKTNTIKTLELELDSVHLNRPVKFDIYLPFRPSPATDPALLLINDGQNMDELGLSAILENLISSGSTKPLVTVAIHAGEERKSEYGTAGHPDYLGRGNKARAYSLFIFEELLPRVRKELAIPHFSEKWFAGFSLGGLSALDIVWAHPHEFTRVGVFSGSLWWRMIDQVDPGYDDDKHRIMHHLVRKGHYASWLKFFFVTGTLDETNDRNNNGIIDSIDDTLGLINELHLKGYHPEKDIVYLELADGRHDVATWAKAMPEFLKWAMGDEKVNTT